jgi:hypothetical protein
MHIECSARSAVDLHFSFLAGLVLLELQCGNGYQNNDNNGAVLKQYVTRKIQFLKQAKQLILMNCTQ